MSARPVVLSSYLAQPYADAEGLERICYPVVLRMVGHGRLRSPPSPLTSVPSFCPRIKGPSPRRRHRTDYPTSGTTRAATIPPPDDQTRCRVKLLTAVDYVSFTRNRCNSKKHGQLAKMIFDIQLGKTSSSQLQAVAVCKRILVEGYAQGWCCAFDRTK